MDVGSSAAAPEIDANMAIAEAVPSHCHLPILCLVDAISRIVELPEFVAKNLSAGLEQVNRGKIVSVHSCGIIAAGLRLKWQERNISRLSGF
jgi:hypothetical protein